MATAFDPFISGPPNFVFIFFGLPAGVAGIVYLVSAAYWDDRRWRGIRPPWRKVWWDQMTWLPHHPEDGYAYGAFCLIVASLCLAGLGARVLGLW